MRGLLLATVAAFAIVTLANAEDDPDILSYPAPKLHPESTGCVTYEGKATISKAPYKGRVTRALEPGRVFDQPEIDFATVNP